MLAPGGGDLTCLIVDDHPSVLESLECLLSGEGIRVVGRASDGRGALRLVEQQEATFAVVDVRLDDISGIEVARRAVPANPRMATILYTSEASAALLREALEAGVRGVVLKEGHPANLLNAISVVAGGGRYVDPRLLLALDRPLNGSEGRER